MDRKWRFRAAPSGAARAVASGRRPLGQDRPYDGGLGSDDLEQPQRRVAGFAQPLLPALDGFRGNIQSRGEEGLRHAEIPAQRRDFPGARLGRRRGDADRY